MSDPNDRFVAHLDMLGMRELVRRDPDLAWACLSRIVQARDDIFDVELEILPDGRRVRIREHVHAVTFSDTMVLFTRSDSEDALRSLLILVTELYGRLLHFSVPFRGGLAHGAFRFNLDAQLFSGPALVNAYLLGEGAQWLGLVVDEATANRSRHLGIETAQGSPMIVQWGVPHDVIIVFAGYCHRISSLTHRWSIGRLSFAGT